MTPLPWKKANDISAHRRSRAKSCLTPRLRILVPLWNGSFVPGHRTLDLSGIPIRFIVSAWDEYFYRARHIIVGIRYGRRTKVRIGLSERGKSAKAPGPIVFNGP